MKNTAFDHLAEALEGARRDDPVIPPRPEPAPHDPKSLVDGYGRPKRGVDLLAAGLEAEK